MSRRFQWLANKLQPTLVQSVSFDVREGLVRLQAANLVGSDKVTFELQVNGESDGSIASWTPYYDQNGQQVALTATRPRYVEILAGTYRAITLATTNSPDLIVSLQDDNLAGDDKVNFNWNVNAGITHGDPVGSGQWVFDAAGNPVWINQVFDEVTGDTETQFSAYPGGPTVASAPVVPDFDHVLYQRDIETSITIASGTGTVALTLPAGYSLASLKLLSSDTLAADFKLLLTGDTSLALNQPYYYLAYTGLPTPQDAVNASFGNRFRSVIGGPQFNSGAKNIVAFSALTPNATVVNFVLRAVFIKN